MKKAALLISAFATVASTQARADDASRYGLLFSETRPINFTGGAAPDTLSVQYLGENCLSAIAVYSVRRAGDGFPVFIKAQPLELADPVSTPEFRHFYEDCQTRGDDRKGESEEFWRLQSAARVDDALSFVPPEAEIDWSADETTKTRAMGKPLLCIRGGYEATECYWFDPDELRARLLFTFGY